VAAAILTSASRPPPPDRREGSPWPPDRSEEDRRISDPDLEWELLPMRSNRITEKCRRGLPFLFWFGKLLFGLAAAGC
jgi:hypothetical protein